MPGSGARDVAWRARPLLILDPPLECGALDDDRVKCNAALVDRNRPTGDCRKWTDI